LRGLKLYSERPDLTVDLLVDQTRRSGLVVFVPFTGRLELNGRPMEDDTQGLDRKRTVNELKSVCIIDSEA